MEKYTLITGASSGIGYELAKIFAKNGHHLILVSRQAPMLNTVAQECKAHNVKVHVIAKDLFEADNAFELYDEVKAKGFDVEILVNNAGQGQYGLFKDTDIKRELDIIQLNINSLVVLTKLFLKDMLAKGEGKILNTSSIASKFPGPYQAVYHGTKAFVQSFTEAIRSELADVNKNIVVTALLPGVTDTDFFNKAEMQKSKAVQDPEKMADPAQVAQDGFEALMSGKDMVVSGTMNKFQVAMAGITPDSTAANQTKKQQEPVDKK
ncbi:MAG TPA: SDR family oxidoreductase [Chitinophagales bacterium]|nr:SDR family oxidoreductase [Chitinophagales bacterium]